MYLRRLWREFQKIAHIRCLIQCLEQNTCSIHVSVPYYHCYYYCCSVLFYAVIITT